MDRIVIGHEALRIAERAWPRYTIVGHDLLWRMRSSVEEWERHLRDSGIVWA